MEFLPRHKLTLQIKILQTKIRKEIKYNSKIK